MRNSNSNEIGQECTPPNHSGGRPESRAKLCAWHLLPISNTPLGLIVPALLIGKDKVSAVALLNLVRVIRTVVECNINQGDLRIAST